MRTLRLIVGVFLALVAAFAGGCALLFLTADNQYAGLVLVVGGVPALIAGLLAYLALRAR